LVVEVMPLDVFGLDRKTLAFRVNDDIRKAAHDAQRSAGVSDPEEAPERPCEAAGCLS